MTGLLPLDSITEHRVSELENKLDVVIWLHAELVYGLRLAVAQQLAQQIQPQVHQALVDQIMAGGVKAI